MLFHLFPYLLVDISLYVLQEYFGDFYFRSLVNGQIPVLPAFGNRAAILPKQRGFHADGKELLHFFFQILFGVFYSFRTAIIYEGTVRFYDCFRGKKRKIYLAARCDLMKETQNRCQNDG